MLRLPGKRIADLRSQLYIPATQQKIRRKKLEILIGKLRSMHLAVPSAIGYFSYLRQALTKALDKLAYMLNNFH